MLKGDSNLAGTILFALAKDFSLPISDSDVSDPNAKLKEFEIQHVNPAMHSLPVPLLLQFLILLSIHQTHTGHAIAARQNIRRAQYYLDQKTSDDDSNAGAGATVGAEETMFWFKAKSRPPCFMLLQVSIAIMLEDNTISAQTLTLSTPPRTVMYAYTFLISTIVQLDPIGRHPKCLHFATSGLERLTDMLDFGRGLPSDEARSGTLWSYSPTLLSHSAPNTNNTFSLGRY